MARFPKTGSICWPRILDKTLIPTPICGHDHLKYTFAVAFWTHNLARRAKAWVDSQSAQASPVQGIGVITFVIGYAHGGARPSEVPLKPKDCAYSRHLSREEY